MKLVDLGRFGEKAFPAFIKGLCTGGCAFAGRQSHTGISGNGHHAIREHVDIGLHGFGRLTGHGLQAVQQNVVCQRLHRERHNYAADNHQYQNIKRGASQYPPIEAPSEFPAVGDRSFSSHV